MTSPKIKPCACNGLRVCLVHYDLLTPHGKRQAQMDAGVRGSWLVSDGRAARTGVA